MAMNAGVAFGATDATGTVAVIYNFYGNGSPGRLFQRSVSLAFSATRVTK